MEKGWWHWLWFSDGGLFVRIAAGAAVLGALLAIDLVRKGRKSPRLREYAFLGVCVAAAMAFGLLNDMVTVTISPAYFISHENLAPDATNVRAVAAAVGLKATWSAGLILGAALLIANNPSRRRPQLPYRRMYAKLVYPIFSAAAGAAILGAAAYVGLLDRLLDISDIPAQRRFMVVYCAHAGGYAGGLLGGVGAVVAVIFQRRRMGRDG